MSFINTNVASLIATQNLNKNNASLQTSLHRLSTGLKINGAADDPAGLIAGTNLQANQNAITQVLSNIDRANSIASTADGALGDISSQLLKLQTLVTQSASSGGLSKDEVSANQQQIDSIVSSINRTASQTSFNGMKLLDGSLDFVNTNAASGATDLVIANANLGTASSMTATVTIGTAATQATAANAIGATLTTAMTVQITGNKGTQVFTFANGATQADIETAINAASAETGIAVNSAHKMISTDYGSQGFVTVKALAGSGGGISDETDVKGDDAKISINGMKATVNGSSVSLRTDNLSLSFTLKNGAPTTGGGDITITGGGAAFNLSPDGGMAGQEVIGIQSVSAYNLGSAAAGHLSDITSGNSADMTTDATKAQQIVNAAIKQVGALRGRLGSFISNTLGSTTDTLQVALQNVTSAQAAISDADFASETANLTRNQILVSAATSVLSIANSAPQSVLKLIG